MYARSNELEKNYLFLDVLGGVFFFTSAGVLILKDFILPFPLDQSSIFCISGSGSRMKLL